MAIDKKAFKAGFASSVENRAPLTASTLNMLAGTSTGKHEVVEISRALLDQHPNQARYSMNEEELNWLAGNIAEVGVLVPISVQPRPDGRYTILAGHRRSEAAGRAGLTAVPAIVEDVSEEQATIIFNATNVGSRDGLTLREKVEGIVEIAESLQKISASNRRTTAALEELTGESRKQLQRYMRIMQLGVALRGMFFDGKIPLYGGVSLSYLSPPAQNNLATFLEANRIGSLSMRQCEELRALGGATGELSAVDIQGYFHPAAEKRPKAKPYKIRAEVLASYFEPGTPNKKVEETIRKALKQYFDINQTEKDGEQ